MAGWPTISDLRSALYDAIVDLPSFLADVVLHDGRVEQFCIDPLGGLIVLVEPSNAVACQRSLAAFERLAIGIPDTYFMLWQSGREASNTLGWAVSRVASADDRARLTDGPFAAASDEEEVRRAVADPTLTRTEFQFLFARMVVWHSGVAQAVLIDASGTRPGQSKSNRTSSSRDNA